MANQYQLGKTATNVRTEHGETCVRYHSTDVVSFTPDRVELHSGGWRTATTKTRMNQASHVFGLGFTVFQKDFDWFVTLPNGETVEFSDGMKFDR